MTSDGRFYDLPDRDQTRFWAPSLRQAVADEPEVLALDAAVDNLDLSALEAKYIPVGPSAYAPRVMVKVLVYGYSLGMRASRDLDRACRMDAAFQFLAHGLKPDFRTICRFRRKNHEQLKELFAQTVRLCQQAGLVNMGHIAIDGTKVRANRSARTLAKAQQALAQALDEAEQADAEISDESDGGDEREASDDECRFMKTLDGMKPAYNAQIAVDSAHQVIVAQEVNTCIADQGQLPAMVQQVQENCNAPPEAVSADGGYYAHSTVEELERKQIKAYLPLPPRARGEFEWVEEEGAYRCPVGHWLRAYRMRKGMMIFRTYCCKGCANAGACGVKGCLKEIHRPLGGKAVEKLARRMKSEEGQAIYAARKQIVEPVLGVLKHDRGFRRFLLRGRSGAGAEWSLMCIAHNLGKWMQAVFPAGSGAGLCTSSAWSEKVADICACALTLLCSWARVVAGQRLWFFPAGRGKLALAA